MECNTVRSRTQRRQRRKKIERDGYCSLCTKMLKRDKIVHVPFVSVGVGGRNGCERVCCAMFVGLIFCFFEMYCELSVTCACTMCCFDQPFGGFLSTQSKKKKHTHTITTPLQHRGHPSNYASIPHIFSMHASSSSCFSCQTHQMC